MMQANDSAQARVHPLKSFAAPFARSRAFPYLWLGHLVSFLGSSVTMIILPVLVLTLTGSTTVMGVVMAVYMLPNVLMLPVSGHLVDRLDRVKIMMVSDIARFAVMGVISALSLMGLLSIPLLCVLMGIYGMLDGLFQPAYAAVRAGVFTPDIRVAANSLTQMTTHTVRLIGPSLGGLLVTHLSAGIGFGISSFTYLLSLVCLLYLRKAMSEARAAALLKETPDASAAPVSVSPAEERAADWKRDFTEGIAVLRSHPWLWITILAFCFVNICFSGISSVLLPWLFKIHHGWEPYVYGLGVTFSGVGAIIAGLLFGMRPRWRHRGMMAYGGALLSGIALLALPFADSPAAAVALYALEGFGLMIFGLIWEISLQELVPHEAFGRVASLDMLGSFALLPLGYVAVGWLADQIGGIPTIALFAGIGMAVVAGVLCVPAIRKFQ